MATYQLNVHFEIQDLHTIVNAYERLVVLKQTDS